MTTTHVLYHGTSAESARRVATEGFQYGVKYNWVGEQQSKEGFVYLSRAYAPFYVMGATDVNDTGAIVKVSVAERDLYPDEDYLAHVYDVPVSNIDIRYYKDMGKQSLAFMGNVAVKPNKVTVIGIREFNTTALLRVCDPVISPEAYAVMGDYYHQLTEWLYEGHDPLAFRHPIMDEWEEAAASCAALNERRSI